MLTRLLANAWLRSLGLTIYYMVILVGLILLYGKHHFTAPPFVYQGF
jgi:hypothetical protein